MLNVKKFRQQLMDNEEVVQYNVNNYDSLELMRALFDYKTFSPSLKAKYAVLKSGAAAMGDSYPNGHVHLISDLVEQYKNVCDKGTEILVSEDGSEYVKGYKFLVAFKRLAIHGVIVYDEFYNSSFWPYFEPLNQ